MQVTDGKEAAAIAAAHPAAEASSWLSTGDWNEADQPAQDESQPEHSEALLPLSNAAESGWEDGPLDLKVPAETDRESSHEEGEQPEASPPEEPDQSQEDLPAKQPVSDVTEEQQLEQEPVSGSSPREVPEPPQVETQEDISPATPTGLTGSGAAIAESADGEPEGTAAPQNGVATEEEATSEHSGEAAEALQEDHDTKPGHSEEAASAQPPEPNGVLPEAASKDGPEHVEGDHSIALVVLCVTDLSPPQSCAANG